MSKLKSQIILMHSFKGGAGRTVSSCNMAFILASELGKKVIFVDTDVESAGASVLFGITDVEGFYTVQHILNGASCDVRVSPDIFQREIWPRLHYQIALPAESKRGGWLKVIPSSMIMRDDDIKLPDGKDPQERYDRLLKQLRHLNDPPELIILDASSGQQATALAGLRACDYYFVFMRWSRQFVDGTIRFIQHYIRFKSMGNIQKIFIVPTAVPEEKPSEPGDLQERQERINLTIRTINVDTYKNNTNILPQDFEWLRLTESIRECNALKWDDEIFGLKDKRRRTRSMMKAEEDYKKLATLLLDEMGK